MIKSTRRVNGYFPENAIEMLEQNLENIPNVSTWAVQMGYSRSYFCQQITKRCGQTPSKILREVRFKCINKQILAYPNKTSYCIARLVGLKNEDALYKFLSNHYDTNYTELRNKLLSRT